MTPEPFYKPLPTGARIFWTLVTLAAFAWCVATFIAAIQ